MFFLSSSLTSLHWWNVNFLSFIIFNIHANEASNAKNSSVLKGRRKQKRENTWKINDDVDVDVDNVDGEEESSSKKWHTEYFLRYFFSLCLSLPSFCRTVFYLIRRVRRSNENKRCFFYISFISMEHGRRIVHQSCSHTTLSPCTHQIQNELKQK